MESGPARWSSRLAFHLAGIGAAVGLGSIWRFPYVMGANGGSVFVFAFVIACFAISTPLLVAEFLIGRRAQRSPPEAAGEVAASCGLARAWNVIGLMGTVTSVLIISSYTVIAGWVLAYAWKCAAGELTGLTRHAVAANFRDFLAHPLRIGAWHVAFVALAAVISARGLNRGVEIVSKIRAPGLLILLLILVAYTLLTGDVAHGLAFAFSLDLRGFSADVLLAATGQAFYATGVGMGMMLAYGAYVPKGVSLVRSALVINGSIVVVSLLATLIIFPLVYRYGLNPAQGAELVFNVLPAAFAEMPAGRLVGTLFFLLLVLAALTPTIAGIEPLIAWLQQRHGISRARAAVGAAAGVWALGTVSALSFNIWADWHPLAWIGRFHAMTIFDALDFICSNVLLPVGALLTSVFVGWRLPRALVSDELQEEGVGVRDLSWMLLRYVCPAAIAAVLLAALL